MAPEPKSRDMATLLRFVVVGASGAVLFFALCLTGLHLGLGAATAGIVAHAVAFCVVYLLQHGWSFGGIARHAHALPRYFVLQAGLGALAGLFVHVAVTRLAFSHLAATALVTLINGTLGYIASRNWVFTNA